MDVQFCIAIFYYSTSDFFLDIANNKVMNRFETFNLHWINKVDDPNNLCAHGRVFVKIGNEVVSDINSMSITVSSPALYL